MDKQYKQMSSKQMLNILLNPVVNRLKKELSKRQTPTPKPRQTPTPKPRRSLQKREQRRLRKQQQEESDEVYNLSDLFKNQTRYIDDYFTNAINQARSLLDEGLVVEINGRILKPDGSTIDEYRTLFYTRAQFNAYLNKLVGTSDIEEWIFTGTVRVVETNIRFNHRRSQAGMGTSHLFRIEEYFGQNCYIPTNGRCFIKCFKQLYPQFKEEADQIFRDFLLNDNRKDRKGIMTNARFGAFNKKLESYYKTSFNLTYYNEKDRHEYPRQPPNNNIWCFYNYVEPGALTGHYCIIRRNCKATAVREVKENFRKIWNTCDDVQVKQVEQYSKKSQEPNDFSTYIFDIETYKDENNFAIPYSVGLARLHKFKTYLGDLINSEENIPEDKYERIVSSNDFISIFTGEDCIHQMFRYIGEHNSSRQITIIGHNSSGFDSFLVAKQFTLQKPPLMVGSKILSLTLSNPYTPAASMRKWKQELKIKGTKDIHQQLTFRCSFQHVKNSLLNWGEKFKIPLNLRKTELEHTGITKDNYREKQLEWEPYLRRDISALTCCVIKYNNTMRNLVGENMTQNLTSSTLTFNGWLRDLKQENILLHSHTNKYVRSYIRRAVKGGRVSANIRKFESDKILIITKILREELNIPEGNITEVIKEYNKATSNTKKKIAKRLKEAINIFTKLMAFDATSLYPSAMIDKDSEYPDARSARAFKREEEEQEFIRLFNSQQFRPRTAILTILYEYPDNLFFQPMPAKDKVFYTSEEINKKGVVHERMNKKDLIRFRNGVIHDTISSVDIQEIVKAGGIIIKIYEGIVYEKNLEVNPYKKFVTRLFELRKKYKKEGNKVGDDLIKLLLNSLYGKMIQKDMNIKAYIWNENTFNAKCNPDQIKKFEQVNDDQYYVEMEKEITDVFDALPTDKAKQTKLLPSHLGVFILSHSKRIMNNFIHSIDGFKNPRIYYTDTDSIYISSELFDKLEQDGFVGNELGKGKNDYGTGGIIYSLFLAPKIKYCIVLDDEYMLQEKKTFKGYTDSKMEVNDYLVLEAGRTVTNDKSKKQWTRSLKDGVTIPNDDDYTKKKYNANVNILKRQSPDVNGLMHPYNIRETDKIYKEIKQKYNLTDNEMLSNYFDVDYIICE